MSILEQIVQTKYIVQTFQEVQYKWKALTLRKFHNCIKKIHVAQGDKFHFCFPHI